MKARLIAGLAVLGFATAASAQAPRPTGDAKRGEELYQSRCSACHSPDAHRAGPLHRGVLGRKAGGAPGYEYSIALKQSSVIWTIDTLEQWLTNPERLIPGQAMGIRVPIPKDRADLVAYLSSLK